MSQSSLFWTLLRERLEAFFADQARGMDIPPAILFRLEGRIELGLELGLTKEADVRRLLAELAEQHLGEEAAQCYLRDDRPILHLHMAEAPVYPSAGDD